MPVKVEIEEKLSPAASIVMTPIASRIRPSHHEIETRLASTDSSSGCRYGAPTSPRGLYRKSELPAKQESTNHRADQGAAGRANNPEVCEMSFCSNTHVMISARPSNQFPQAPGAARGHQADPVAQDHALIAMVSDIPRCLTSLAQSTFLNAARGRRREPSSKSPLFSEAMSVS